MQRNMTTRPNRSARGAPAKSRVRVAAKTDAAQKTVSAARIVTVARTGNAVSKDVAVKTATARIANAAPATAAAAPANPAKGVVVTKAAVAMDAAAKAVIAVVAPAVRSKSQIRISCSIKSPAEGTPSVGLFLFFFPNRSPLLRESKFNERENSFG